MKKAVIGIVAVLTVGILATNAFSWGHGGGRRGGCGGMGYNAAADLTPEQKDQLRTLRQKFIDETYETRAALMNKHQEIQMLMETSTPSREKLEALSNDILDLKKAMQGKLIDYALEAKKIAPELNINAFGRHHGGFGKRGFGKGGYGDCPWKNQGPATDQ